MYNNTECSAVCVARYRQFTIVYSELKMSHCMNIYTHTHTHTHTHTCVHVPSNWDFTMLYTLSFQVA